MHLLNHLATQFPNLPLTPSLFHNSPIGLRFELSLKTGRGDEHDEYDHTAVLRAQTLYESAFSPTDTSYIAAITPRNRGLRNRPGRKLNLFQYSRAFALGLPRPSGSHKQQLPGDIPESIHWAQISPCQIDYPAILEAIARSDFAPRHRLTSDVYFINLTRNLIFHMYDDRGLDLVATRSTTLQPIYDQHKSWLLRYNLTRMQQTFEP